jgi:hypothetical protein
MAATYGFTIDVAGNSIAEMKKIEEELERLGIKAGAETHKVKAEFEGMAEGISEAFENLKGLFLGGLGIAAIFEGWEFIKKSKEEFEALEKAVTRVDTVLKSTKFGAGFSSQDIQNQAEELGKGIVNKRAEILDAQGMLLSFRDVKGVKFEDTMKSVADFATFYKESMTDAALQVGKAVNDPLRGMTRLQRMGVEFSEQQKEQIKNYIQQGKLAEAQEVILKELRSEFGGQAQAFATTDAGKVQMASKQWEELQFEIGEVISKVEVSLIPSFLKFIEVIKDVFNSAPVQFFLEHLKDLVDIVLKLIPIWLGYKAAVAGAALITETFAYENGILTVSMGEVTVMTDGATTAIEGLEGAMMSIGVGALVIGIGLLIEKFIGWNEEIDKTVDKLSGIKEISQQFERSESQMNKINLEFSNLKNLDKNQQRGLLGDIDNQIKDIQNKLATNLQPQLEKTKKAMVDFDQRTGKESLKVFGHGSGWDEHGSKVEKTALDLHSAYDKTTKTIGEYTKMLKELQEKQIELKKHGVKPLSGLGTSATTDSAYATSQLSGAQGGLGEAKVINIHIDTVQKIDKVQGENLDAAAQKAVEYIIRTVNNLAYSQSSM